MLVDRVGDLVCVVGGGGDKHLLCNSFVYFVVIHYFEIWLDEEQVVHVGKGSGERVITDR